MPILQAAVPGVYAEIYPLVSGAFVEPSPQRPMAIVVHGDLPIETAEGAGASLALSVTGGLPPFSWSVPDETQGLTNVQATGERTANFNVTSSLPAGNGWGRTVRVEDDNGAVATRPITINVSEAPAPSLTLRRAGVVIPGAYVASIPCRTRLKEASAAGLTDYISGLDLMESSFTGPANPPVDGSSWWSTNSGTGDVTIAVVPITAGGRSTGVSSEFGTDTNIEASGYSHDAESNVGLMLSTDEGAPGTYRFTLDAPLRIHSGSPNAWAVPTILYVFEGLVPHGDVLAWLSAPGRPAGIGCLLDSNESTDPTNPGFDSVGDGVRILTMASPYNGTTIYLDHADPDGDPANVVTEASSIRVGNSSHHPAVVRDGADTRVSYVLIRKGSVE